MLSWVIQISVISIILIFLVHHLINFFKCTLTVPKVKDLVNSPSQKYKNMYNIISNNNSEQYTSNYEITDLLPKPDDNKNMKTELKNFLKKQLNTNVVETTNISALDSMRSHSFLDFSPI